LRFDSFSFLLNRLKFSDIRKDSVGNLQEEHTHDNTSSLILPLGMLNSVILTVENVLEDDLKSLRQEVRSQNERLAALEKSNEATEESNNKEKDR
jgi:hypothetical protein